MKKLMLTTTLLMLTACGKSPSQVATWASGSAPSLRAESIETEILKVEDAVETTAEVSDAVEQLFKGSSAVNFSMDPSMDKLAHGPAQFWLGCSTSALVKGGYGSDTKCGKAYFHPTFTKQMQSRFFMCAERAASKANIAQPQKIFMNHDGSYNNRTARNSSRLSMHAYARAVDVAAFNLYDARGKVTKISTNVRNFRGTTKVFYNEFRQCWKEAMPKTCTPGKTEFKGSIGIPSSALGGNKLHNDHIHLSYAPCAG